MTLSVSEAAAWQFCVERIFSLYFFFTMKHHVYDMLTSLCDANVVYLFVLSLVLVMHID